MLLMKTYMKLLDENLPESKHTRFIHDELTRIAERCEEHLAVSSSQLNKLKDRVDNKPECFDSQVLIWHGSVKKQSPRKRTDVAQRYLILFANCILVYKESGNKLEIKRLLSIKDITVDVLESRPLEPPTTGQQINITNYYPFRVNAVEKSYEFLVDKELDREKWVNKIRQTSEEFKTGNSPIASKKDIYILIIFLILIQFVYHLVILLKNNMVIVLQHGLLIMMYHVVKFVIIVFEQI